ESLDVLKRALRESVEKAEMALDAQDGEVHEALQRAQKEKEDLLRELRSLRAEVSRLRAGDGASEADAACGSFVQSWWPWCACSADSEVLQQARSADTAAVAAPRSRRREERSDRDHDRWFSQPKSAVHALANPKVTFK
ncbi:unnamed protein product, partial [Polarella glacialis]